MDKIKENNVKKKSWPQKAISLSKRKKDAIFYSILLAWPLLQFCVFYIGVNFNSILLAFKKYESGDSYTWAGVQNFVELFESFEILTVFKKAFLNSGIHFLAGLLIGMVLGIVFSYYVYKKMLGNGFFKVMLFLPSIIPSIAMIVIYLQIAESALPSILQNLIDKDVQKVMILPFLSNPKVSMGTLIFFNIWISFGSTVLLEVGAMSNISESIVEAANLDGIGFFGELFYITIPMIWQTLSVFIVTSMGGLFVNQANLYAFWQGTAPEDMQVIGYYLYKETVKAGALASYPRLAAFGLFLTLITMPLVYLTKFALDKFGPSVE